MLYAFAGNGGYSVCFMHFGRPNSPFETSYSGTSYMYNANLLSITYV